MEECSTAGVDLTSERVLIVKFSAIGDCVMAVPALSALRRRNPDANIVWAIDPRCGAVVDTSRLVDSVFEIPREKWKREKSGLFTQLRHFLKLRDWSFDFGLDLQGHGKTAVALRLSGAKVRRSAYAFDPAARWLNPQTRGGQNRIHRVERNMEAVAELLEMDEDFSPIMPPAILPGGLPERFISIHTGAGAVWKQWPIERWEAVAKALPVPVVFLGGPTDPVPGAGGVNLVGKLSLEASMGVVAHSAYHLAADTGSGHMAAAYGVPVLSVFGKTMPALYRPYTDHGVTLRKSADPASVQVQDVLEGFERLTKL